jgi:hypothetical protein
MPSRTIFTDGSATPITLSVNEVCGQRITTIIDIDGAELPAIQSNFNNLQIGTNASLAGTTVNVTTTAIKVTPAGNSEVDYTLKGSGPDAPDSDDQDFNAAGDPISHLMTYIMF